MLGLDYYKNGDFCEDYEAQVGLGSGLVLIHMIVCQIYLGCLKLVTANFANCHI